MVAAETLSRSSFREHGIGHHGILDAEYVGADPMDSG